MARYLAIDWDQNQLHVVAADVGTKGAVRVRKAIVWQQPQVPNVAQAEDLGKLLKEHLKEAGIAPAPVLACLGRDRLIVKEVRYPAVPEAEEPAVIRFQAVKELTESADEVIIDYVLGGTARGTLTSDRKAVALVIRKEILEAYRALCEAAGLKLAGFTPRLLGANACLRKVMGTTVLTPAPTPPEGVIAMVVAGERYAEISILKGDLVLLTRSVPSNAALAGEIRRNLAVHVGQTPHLPVVAVYLTGKGSAELRQKFSEQSDLPVYTFDPFAACEGTEVVVVGDQLTQAGITPAEKLDAAEASRRPAAARGTFAGAMGLLYLKSAGDLPVNFVTPKQPKPPSTAMNPRPVLAAAAGIVVFIGALVMGQMLYQQKKAELDSLTRLAEDTDKQLTETRANAKRLKEIDEWDEPVWLDELYDLTARITDVNALRITSIQTEVLPHNEKTRAVAKATIKGKLLNPRDPRRALNELMANFRGDLYYTTEPPKVDQDTFTLAVQIERRPPSEYKRVVTEQPARRGFGGPGKAGEDNDDGDDEAGAQKGAAKAKPAGKEKQDGKRGGAQGKRRPGGDL